MIKSFLRTPELVIEWLGLQMKRFFPLFREAFVYIKVNENLYTERYTLFSFTRVHVWDLRLTNKSQFRLWTVRDYSIGRKKDHKTNKLRLKNI